MRSEWAVAVWAVGMAFVIATGGVRASVVINELLADPASDWSPSDGDLIADPVDDEWLEIFNAGPGPVDITGWRLRDALSDSSWKYGFDGIMYPGEFIVVYGNEAYEWEGEHGYLRNGLGMNNSGDTMTLVRSDLTTVVDTTAYVGSQVKDDRSYGRFPDAGGEWVVFDALNPMVPPATGFHPSPGSSNGSTPVDRTSWGKIKALFW